MIVRFTLALLSMLAVAASPKANAADRPFAFEQLYINHKTTEYYGVKTPVLTGFRSVEAWCKNNVETISGLATFEVTTYVVDQADGLYDCKGQFAKQLTESSLIIHKIASCTPVDSVALRATCPPTGR